VVNIEDAVAVEEGRRAHAGSIVPAIAPAF
jgi:hypothetical protein